MNTKNAFTNIIMNADYIQNKNTKFSDFINIETKLTDQKNSGRCWLFAFMNVMRLPMIKKYNLVRIQVEALQIELSCFAILVLQFLLVFFSREANKI